MGYTHYWARPGMLPRAKFAAAVADCQRLCHAMAIPLGNGQGEAGPIFTADEICFNGHINNIRPASAEIGNRREVEFRNARGDEPVGDANTVIPDWKTGLADQVGLLGANGNGSCEAFRIVRVCQNRRLQERPDEWRSDFCKTNHLLYDLCVQGCLIVLSHHFGNEHFRVSSDGTSHDWNDARAACQQILGYGIDWGDGKLTPETRPMAPSNGNVRDVT